EAEAQRRRSGSQDVRQPPSGNVAPVSGAWNAKPNRTLQAVLLAVGLLVLIGGGTLAVMLARPAHHRPAAPAPIHTQPILPETTAVPTPTLQTPPMVSAPALEPSPNASATTQEEQTAAFTQVKAIGTAPDGRGGYVLRLYAAGKVHVSRPLTGTVAAFFYD